MKRFILTVAAAIALPATLHAAPLDCATDARTDAVMCYPKKGVTTSTDGFVREVRLYRGGPRQVNDTGFTARIFCTTSIVPIMEMRDRQGVVFAREQAVTRLGMDFTRFVCAHTPTKINKALDKAERPKQK